MSTDTILLLMKQVLFYFTLFLFCACSVESYYSERLSEIPLGRSNESIQIFYLGDSLPNREYSPVVTFNFSLKGDIPSEECYKILKQKALIAGVDAVINVHENVHSRIGMTGADFIFTFASAAFSDDGSYTVYESEIYTTQVTGTGIKYLDNLHDLNNLIKTQNIYMIDPNNPDKDIRVAVINKNMLGKTIAIDYLVDSINYLVGNYLLPYSDYILFNETNGWSFQLDELGHLKKRIKDRNGSRDVYRFFYEDDGKLRLIKYRNEQQAKYARIYLEVDGKNRIKSKIIKKGNCMVTIKNMYRYNRLVCQKIRCSFNDKEIDLYILNSFYSPEEIAQYIEEQKELADASF